MTVKSRRCYYVARLSILLISMALIAGGISCGDSTSGNLEIRDWYDLDAVRDNLARNHILMNDLDSTTAGYNELASPTANGEAGWQPIGGEFSLFTGSFNGQGHEIRGLFINRPDESWVGLFSTVDEEGVIKNIGVVNANVIGEHGVGGLAGFNGGTVSNSYLTGGVTGEERVGGLVGQSRGTISKSHFTGDVTGSSSVGGLVGWSYGSTVSNSFYNYDETLINDENIITVGALFPDDFDEWLANDKFLYVNERLSQEDGYYVVNNISDFKELLAFGQNATLKFRLKNDLDLAAEPGLYIPYLAGEFDGNGHEISNLSFDFDFVSHVGLFGYLAPGAKVTRVGVDNVNVTGTSSVGGLVGYNHGGTVSKSHAIGSVTGNEDVGGLVGYNVKGTVSNCYAAANLTGDMEAGGLVGLNKEGAVSNSYSTGNVNGNMNVGGLVGRNWGTVSNSYSIADVTGEYTVGGLVGGNFDTVSNSYSTGNVTGDEEVGGLVGLNEGTVSNSYSTGSVSGNEDVGGLVGVNYGPVSTSFWDIETSGQATSDGGTGRTTAQMKSITTFSGAGWNIIAVGGSGTRNTAYIWNIVADETYPFLSWQP
jgi:hypothetical protein